LKEIEENMKKRAENAKFFAPAAGKYSEEMFLW